MKTLRLLALATLSGLAAFGASADEADGSDRALNATSTRSAAEVRAEARNPVRITNGGTGILQVDATTATSRDAVRAQAEQSARAGTTSRGEFAPM